MSIKSSFPTDSPSLVLDFANSRRLDPRITFTRTATGNVASYMGPDGLVKFAGPNAPRFDHRYVARTNLLIYSQEFNQSAWGKNQCNISTNNTTAPDGTTTAEALIATSVDPYIQQPVDLPADTYTFSVYLKAKPGISSKQINLRYRTASSTYFASGYIEITEEWERYSYTFTATESINLVRVDSPEQSTVSGDVTYIWGAQLEKNDTATAYIPTNSAPATESYMESLGLLIEEQRTNFCNTFDPSTNQLVSIVSSYLDITSTSEINPNGSSAVAYTATYNQPGNQFHGFPASKAYTGVTTNKTISHSYFIKEFNNSDYRLYFTLNARNATTGNSNYVLARFQPRTGSFISLSVGSVWADVSTKVEEYPNGWYRATVTATYVAQAGRENIDLAAQLLDENNQQFYNPPSANTHGLFIWGPQVEEGGFPTSYIPSAPGSEITRNVDKAEITGDNFLSFYNQSEGTFFADFVGQTIRPSISYDRYIAFVGADPNNDEMGFFTQTASGGGAQNKIQAVLSIGGVSTAVPGVLSGQGPDFGGKAIFAYKQDDGAFTVNNFAINKYSDLDVFTSMIALRIFGRARYQPEPSGHISKFVYYPLRLSNAQLQTLTN